MKKTLHILTKNNIVSYIVIRNFWIITTIFLFHTHICHATIVNIKWTDTNSSTEYSSPIFSCSTPKKVHFKVGYQHNDNIFFPTNSNCGLGGWGQNPFKYIFELFRDGVSISKQEFQSSTCVAITWFYNVDAIPGKYKADIVFKKRDSPTTYKTLGAFSTTEIEAKYLSPTIDFNVNGIAIPSDNTPLQFNIMNTININASNCNCESKYQLVVQESDQFWNRTYDYEWGKWFSGQAPNNLNLQQLSASYSIGTDYIGSPNRQGTPLIGGNLSNGQPRYYRVSVCSGDPYICKFVLIKINY